MIKRMFTRSIVSVQVWCFTLFVTVRDPNGSAMNKTVTLDMLVFSILSSVSQYGGHTMTFQRLRTYSDNDRHQQQPKQRAERNGPQTAESGNHVHLETIISDSGRRSTRLTLWDGADNFWTGSSPLRGISKSNWQYLHKVPFKRGDEFKTRHGSYAIAVDEDRLIFMRVPWPWQTETTLGYLHRKIDTRVKIREVRINGLFDKEIGLTLAERLVGRKLPFGSAECNGDHYITYFLDGLSYRSKFSECPLNKSLLFLSVDTVTDDAFELIDAKNRRVRISSLPKYTGGNDVTVKASAGQFKRTNSPTNKLRRT